MVLGDQVSNRRDPSRKIVADRFNSRGERRLKVVVPTDLAPESQGKTFAHSKEMRNIANIILNSNSKNAIIYKSPARNQI
jgi:hypothetical protein